MKSKARTLRTDATPEERLLWARLRDIHPRFTRQLPIGAYIVDFACRTAKVAVELDGSQHLAAKTYDKERTDFLESLGWQVLRFWNNDVRDNVDGVAETIVSAVSDRLGRTHPQPLPFREGST
ncbi:endonuclease domain-containing protein [Sphingomonas oryzagri]|jgi:very-short-patch-repair endonuclease|uniref:DUF559 domain-containing protein n=1 Tax=Sphingomonas oryzagri TaxID=3042314 RepID=A0ABT6N7L4_9SPHN|nr:DUF559 domain-containing protein [Sphingomonas oryzagri]MDH7641109.1 DUF559 domain-containing protein [Sphingomonas oryzagri]